MTRSEAAVAAGVALLCLIASLAPAMPQDPTYHQFADARTLFGVPSALNVLSSVPFILAGTYGLVLVATRRLSFFSRALKMGAVAFFAGFVATGLGSACYHLAPDDGGLAWDRLGMVVAFAGVLGMVVAQRVSERAGAIMLGFALFAGPASVFWWVTHGSVTPYAVLQFGGALTVASCLLATPRGMGPDWALLLVTYALAKAAEHFDTGIFALTGEGVSGHTLKHLLAALAALAVVRPLLSRAGVEPAIWRGPPLREERNGVE